MRQHSRCAPCPTPSPLVHSCTLTPQHPQASRSSEHAQIGGFYMPTPCNERTNPPGQRYDKPALNENDLIERYVERGLIITDRNPTARYLRHIGYCQLTPVTRRSDSSIRGEPAFHGVTRGLSTPSPLRLRPTALHPDPSGLLPTQTPIGKASQPGRPRLNPPPLDTPHRAPPTTFNKHHRKTDNNDSN